MTALATLPAPAHVPPQHATRSCTLPLFVLVLLTPMATLLLAGYFPVHRAPLPVASGLPAPLTFVTLSFNSSFDDPTITHNCVVISRSRHRLFIHTDDPDKAYCSVCRCVRFVATNCTCPGSGSRGVDEPCPLCEKLRFVDSLLATLPAFVYLDTDLTIVKPHFMDRLAARAMHFDFLASYGFGDLCTRTHGAMFNSGLFFMRRVREWRQGMLSELMTEMGATNDQNVISTFVYKKIAEWDSLSMQWHCRFLQRNNYKIPPSRCYTLHGRGPSIKETLRSLNHSLLTIDRTS